MDKKEKEQVIKEFQLLETALKKLELH